MAFKARNLRPIGDNSTAGVVPSLWLYFNEASDTMTTAGFIPTKYGIKAKDQICVVPANGHDATWYYVTVSGSTATLVAYS